MVYLRTVLQYILVLIVTLSINFALPRIAPGSPLIYLVGEDVATMTQEEMDQVLREFGLDKSVPEQFVDYVTGIFQGNLGTSVKYGLPVTEVVFRHLPWTLLLMGTSLLLSAVIGTVIGVLAAWRQGGKQDIGALSLVLFMGSIPPFWVAMLLITFFSAKLGWLPSFGAYGIADSPGTMEYYWGVLQRMIMPVLALTLVRTGSMFLTARSSMAMALDEDYIMLAHAKGVRERSVVFKHGFRNALLPIYTNIMVGIGFLVGGAMVIETVFSYPGLGSVIYDSVLARDYNLLQGTFLLITMSVLLANLVADLGYPLLDPRIRRPGARA